MRVITGSVVRVYPSHARPSARSCPRFLAEKARPTTWKAPAEQTKQTGLTTFSGEPVDDVLDHVEFHDLTVEEAHRAHRSTKRGARCHASLLRWTEHAVSTYLRVGEQLSVVDGTRLDPYSREWAVQFPVNPDPDDDVVEIRAIGRRYKSAGGDVRELRLSRNHSVDDSSVRRVPIAELATIAYVLAEGRTVHDRWKIPLVMSRNAPEVRRVRIVEIGLHDGSYDVIFDGTADDARALYRNHARGPLREATTGEGYLPGHDCRRCHLRTTCEGLRRRPGLLGVLDQTKPGRSWSVTTGRRHQACPGLAHGRDLRLPYPTEVEYGVEARRGNAVHAWIATLHEREPRRPCHPRDVPADRDTWWRTWSLDGDAALLGEQMIGDHAAVCPLRTMAEDDHLLSEHAITVYDPNADVVVHAKLDTLYTEGDTAVLRETKTTKHVDEDDLLHRFPQIALGVVLAAEGLLDAPLARVELERLNPAGPLLTSFDPADPWVVARAREVVRALAAPWHADLDMRPTPGRACKTCEVARWCTAFQDES